MLGITLWIAESHNKHYNDKEVNKILPNMEEYEKLTFCMPQVYGLLCCVDVRHCKHLNITVVCKVF